MNSFKINPNLNFILGKGGGGTRFSEIFNKESKSKL